VRDVCPRYIHNLLDSFIFGVTILMDSQFSRTQYLLTSGVYETKSLK